MQGLGFRAQGDNYSRIRNIDYTGSFVPVEELRASGSSTLPCYFLKAEP